jgi:hypothetical protein
MNKQLEVFKDVDEHRFKVGDCVQIGFVRGRVEPEFDFIGQDLFEFDMFSLSPVTHYGFNEKEFRSVYPFDQITSNLPIC